MHCKTHSLLPSLFYWWCHLAGQQMMNQLTVLTQEIVVTTASQQTLFTLFKWLEVIWQAFVINLESFFSWFEQPASNHVLLQLHLHLYCLHHHHPHPPHHHNYHYQYFDNQHLFQIFFTFQQRFYICWCFLPPFHPTTCPIFSLSQQNSNISPKCRVILIALTSVRNLFLYNMKCRRAGLNLIFKIFDKKLRSGSI